VVVVLVVVAAVVVGGVVFAGAFDPETAVTLVGRWG
jgi:hypothetical protein